MSHYNRAGALGYAAYFHDKVCHDARVATKVGYPSTINGIALSPGLPFSELGHVDQEEDCTHFISCCVGQTVSRIPVGEIVVEHVAGGLAIASPFKAQGVYGETYVPRLVGTLISLGARFMGPQFQVKAYDATRAAILTSLTTGDILAYASRDDANHYEHMAMITGGTLIACHTTSRFAQDFTDVYHPWVSLIKMPN